jgi:hypothetical protein
MMVVIMTPGEGLEPLAKNTKSTTVTCLHHLLRPPIHSTLPPEIRETIQKMAFNAQMSELGNVVRRMSPKVTFMVPLKGQVSKKWGHYVWQAEDGAIYGTYKNNENCYAFVFLGWTEDQALQRVNHVKSFLLFFKTSLFYVIVFTFMYF